MVQLLNLSPAAYDAFAGAMAMAEHRVQLQVEAHFVACISAPLADDCGAGAFAHPCAWRSKTASTAICCVTC